VHRREWDTADQRLDIARQEAQKLRDAIDGYPDLYHSGYTQDALKEFVEAFATYALVRGSDLPTPESLNVEQSTYLNGMAEAASELRRQILDIIRQGHSEEAERLLTAMDTIYSVLITIDFHDAITGGLRRRLDSLRGVLERTRGDVTTSLRQQQLRAALADFEKRIGMKDGDLDSLVDEEDMDEGDQEN
jgi:translin